MEPEKIDLSSLNNAKRQPGLSRLLGMFKKRSAGQERDAEGRFTSGTGGISAGKKLNFKRIVPIVVITSLVGGFFVFRSFAAVTKPPAYQYSITICKNEKTKQAIEKCKDESAEAFTYRMQAAVLGRQTDYGYKTWNQNLAGDRATTLRVAQLVTSTNEARWGNMSNKDFVDKVAGLATAKQRAAWTQQIDKGTLKRVELATNVARLFNFRTADGEVDVERAMLPSYKDSNYDFVQAIYKNLLKRGSEYALPATSSYVQQLNNRTQTRAQIARTIVVSPEAKSKNRAAIDTYLAKNSTKLKIIPTAMNKQDARKRDANRYASDAKIHYQSGSMHHRKAAAPFVDRANKAAHSDTPDQKLLDSIVGMQKQVDLHVNYAAESAANAKRAYEKAKKLMLEAKELTKHSPDIPSSGVEQAAGAAAIYAGQAQNELTTTKRYRSALTTSYSIAEERYIAEQKKRDDILRFAQLIKEQKDQCARESGTWSDTTGCTHPVDYGAMAFYADMNNPRCERTGSYIFPQSHGRFRSCHTGLAASAAGAKENVRGSCPRYYAARWRNSENSRNGAPAWVGVVCVREDKASTIGQAFNLRP
jgi:hypothetical protein